VDEIAATLEVSAGAAERAVRSLESQGLLTRGAGEVDSLIPVSPNLAIEALVLRRQQELGKLRNLADRLEKEYLTRSVRTSSAELVEVLDSPAVVGERALQLLHAAREELLSFDKPPYTTSAEESDPALEAAMARGVRVRAIYDRESLMNPPVGLGLEAVRQFQVMGEESRVFPELPFKMNIVDRDTALLPLVFERSGSVGGALVVRSKHLVEALGSLWDILWTQALPIPSAEVAETSSLESFLSSEADLINLLLAGAKSEAIAHQLGIGVSTAERRIRRLMNALGADTRFQAGYQLARRGMVLEER
jgi:hypothetical protein